MGIGNQN